MRFGLLVVLLGVVAGSAGAADGDRAAIDDLLKTGYSTGGSSVTFSPAGHTPPTPIKRLALGVNYSGAQCRWRFGRAWGAEMRFQHGEASGENGRVSADVFGVRGYRFLRQYRSALLYMGGEAAYSQAEADRNAFAVSGPIGGAFGGVEIRVAKNVALGIDIGPYVLSLREKRTQVSDTNLDFVLNTGLLWYLF